MSHKLQTLETPLLFKDHTTQGEIQYLTFMRPNISFVVNYVCQHMQNPTYLHFSQVKSILKYVKGTLEYEQLLSANIDFQLSLFGFRLCCPFTKRSIAGFVQLLGPIVFHGLPRNNLLFLDLVQRTSILEIKRGYNCNLLFLIFTILKCHLVCHVVTTILHSLEPTLFCINNDSSQEQYKLYLRNLTGHPS